MWDIKHKSGTLLFTTSDKSVADNRRTMGWVVEMKRLTVEKAQELIEQLSQGERSCREEYYLQALTIAVMALDENYAIVPVEATEDMTDAGDIWCDGLTNLGPAYEMMVNVGRVGI